MNSEYFSIITNEYHSYGRCTNSKMFLPTPENVRDVPCEGCPNMNSCGSSGAECVAFRQWSSSGDFGDADVGRLIRVPRNLR